MSYQPQTPFENIEMSHEYLGLLGQAVAEAQESVQSDLAAATADVGTGRRAEALRLVAYKLERLAQHVQYGRRVLNDLRTLRRLLLGERAEPVEPASATNAASPGLQG